MAESQAVIKVNCFMVGMVQTNFYYLHREGSKETIAFDPADHQMLKPFQRISLLFIPQDLVPAQQSERRLEPFHAVSAVSGALASVFSYSLPV